MMKTTQLKIEKALKHFENTDFSIREVVEKSGVSYPTIKNYLANLPVREVSYGRYEIITNPISCSKNEAEAEDKNQPSLTTDKPQALSHDLEEIKEIYGDLYVAAYLKGFDRGFELGLQKAK